MEKSLFEQHGGTYRQEGVTEAIKAENQMKWVGRMNNIRNRAEEIVYNEIICQ